MAYKQKRVTKRQKKAMDRYLKTPLTPKSAKRVRSAFGSGKKGSQAARSSAIASFMKKRGLG